MMLDELIVAFRDALVALVPIADRVRIPWQEEQAYDDWDVIAGCLFNQIIVKSIEHAVDMNHDSLPRYDVIQPRYEAPYIRVRTEEASKDSVGVFLALAGTSPDFDRVKWLELDPLGYPLGPVRATELHRCQFSLVLQQQQRLVEHRKFQVPL